MCFTTWHQGQREAKTGKLEVIGWQGFVAWFLSLEWQLLDSYGHTSMLCLCRGLWAHPQLVLLSPAGMHTETLCSSQVKGAQATTAFLSSLGPAMSSWLQSCICGLSQPYSLLTSLICCTCPPLEALMDRSFQACLYIEQGISCWVIAVQIVENLRGEILGISHIIIPLISPRSPI